MKRILLLSANPFDTTQLRVDEEMREIREGLRRSKQRENFVIETALAVPYRDIRRAILDHEPNIVHFSGHGAGEEGLIFEDETGQSKLVEADALARLFELFADSIECVVLNACYSEVQAKVIAQQIPYVVGMDKAIGDKAAIEFAVGFYDGLGAGKSVEFAYKLGCNSIEIAGIPEHLTPQLLSNPDAMTSRPWSERDIKEHTEPSKQGGTIYIERPPIEQRCYQEILKDGALIRIRASQKMGKTLLMNKIFDYAKNEGNYQTVSIDLEEPEELIVRDLSEFLQFFCSDVSLKLGLSDQTEEYWAKKTPKSKTLKCRGYFESEILNKLTTPLVLGLDNVERIFSDKFESVAADFFGMLRSWHNRGKSKDIWKKFKLIIVYSTEKIPNLGPHESPFNVGEEMTLPGFTQSQISCLAKQYKVVWSEQKSEQLMVQLGGHPYLVRLALEHFSREKNASLPEILEKAATDEGIYYKHFQNYWSLLGEKQELAKALSTVVTSSNPVLIEPKILYELESLGLIRKVGNQVSPKCELYRRYFSNHLR